MLLNSWASVELTESSRDIRTVVRKRRRLYRSGWYSADSDRVPDVDARIDYNSIGTGESFEPERKYIIHRNTHTSSFEACCHRQRSAAMTTY